MSLKRDFNYSFGVLLC